MNKAAQSSENLITKRFVYPEHDDFRIMPIIHDFEMLIDEFTLNCLGESLIQQIAVLQLTRLHQYKT